MTFLISRYKKLSQISIWLVSVILLILFCTVILILFQVKPNSLSLIKYFIIPRYSIGDDSWKAMIEALKHIKESPQEPAYDALFADGIKFQYPLTSLLLFDLPNKITGISYENIVNFLNSISRFSVIITGLVTARILVLLLKQKQFEKLSIKASTETIVLYSLVLLLTFLFHPLLRSYAVGQIQTLLTLLAVISIWCWQCNRKILAGVIIGFICLIKPQLILLFIWGLLRKQWSMVISGGIVIVIFGVIAIVLYGFENNLYYLEILSYISRHGESFYANQSINGLMNRILFNGEILSWDGKFPPYSPIIYIVTLFSSLSFMIAGLFWNYKSKNPGLIDLCIVILCTTMASPVAWEHHYGIMLTIFIVLSPYACHFYWNKKWTLLLLAFGYLLVSQYFESVKIFTNSELNILQSYLFFGACIILYFLFSVSKKIKNQSALAEV